MYFLFLNLGAGEVMVIALFVLMFFGSKQIPDLMRGLGRATREFKDAMNGIEREVRNATSITDDERTTTTAPAAPLSVPQTQKRDMENRVGEAGAVRVEEEDSVKADEGDKERTGEGEMRRKDQGEIL